MVKAIVAALCLLLLGLQGASIGPACGIAHERLLLPRELSYGARPEWVIHEEGRRVSLNVLRFRGGGGGQAQLDQAEKNAREEEERRVGILAEKKKKGMPPDSIMIPYDVHKVQEAVTIACGRIGRYLAYPEPNRDDFIEPEIDEKGEPILVTWAEWSPGTGQKIYARWGLYRWGTWSERKQAYRQPRLIAVKGHLDFRGEDGTVLCGQWAMLQGSSGIFKSLMLKTQQYIPGVCSGMCLHIDGGDWKFEECQLRCTPGPLMTIMGVSSLANVTIDWCLVTRDINVAFGAHGYGIMSWGKGPKVNAINSTFTCLKVAVDSADYSTMNFTECEFDHNRVGFMLRGHSKINVTDSIFCDNHKASVVMGKPNRGSVERRGPPRAELRIRGTTFKSNDVFFGDDRPWLFEEQDSIYKEMDNKPTTYKDTNIDLRSVPQAPPLLSEESIERLQYRKWWYGNWTSERPAVVDWDISKAFENC